MKKLVMGLFAAIAFAGSSHAAELMPLQAKSIVLGTVTGVAYYTVADDGYRVVATLAAEGGVPMRFVATLASGQRMVLSVPKAVDEQPMDVEIARLGDAVFVTEPVTLMN
jgi:hypothetical protein